MSLASGPTEHLSWQELACKDGTLYPREFIEDGRVYRLAHVYETIRKITGNHPIRIQSAFRTPEHNKKVGGALSSYHLKGMALDIKHTKLTVSQLYTYVHKYALPLGLGGLGLYRTFIHIDIRPSPSLVVWSQFNGENKTSRG